MEFTERKSNRSHDHDYNTHGVYFVTICTQDRAKILSDIVGDDQKTATESDLYYCSFYQGPCHK